MPIGLAIFEFDAARYTEVDGMTTEVVAEECYTAATVYGLLMELAERTEAARCKTLQDEAPRMAKQRLVKIHIFDLAAHSWYIGRPASFGTQSTVSIMSLVGSRAFYLSPSAITTCYGRALTRRGLMDRSDGDLRWVIPHLSGVYNSLVVGS